MDRTTELIQFLEYEHGKNVIIEPKHRKDEIFDNLKEIIDTYNPEVIVKAGLGSDELLFSLLKAYDKYFVVVEPSIKNIKSFIAKYKDEEVFERIHFINGEFNKFPVDYYASNLLISLDNFNMLESNIVVDEYRRALDFENILFIGVVVLHKDDLDGVYDDYMRMLMPLHNDYYIENDLNTFLDLNEFKLIKSNIEYRKENINDIQEHINGIYKSEKDYTSFLDENSEILKKLYNYDGELINIPYYTGVFMRKKPKVPTE